MNTNEMINIRNPEIMNQEEKYILETQNYAIINERVILFDVGTEFPCIFNEFKTVSSAGLVCIWRKGDRQHLICCNESAFFPVLCKPETDRQLVAGHMGIILRRS